MVRYQPAHNGVIGVPQVTRLARASRAPSRRYAAVVETPVVLFGLQADPAPPVLRDRGMAVLFTVERVQVTDLPVDDKHVTGLELKLGSRASHQLAVGAPDHQRHRRAA
jgi:hypothetical protein